MLDPIAENIKITLTCDQIKQQINVEHCEDDELIESYIAAAVAQIDGPNGIYGKGLFEQEVSQKLEGLGSKICLPYGPVNSIISIEYYDSDNQKQTLSNQTNVLKKSGIHYLVIDGDLPAVYSREDAVDIKYMSGDKDNAVIHAMKMLVAHWYKKRESVSTAKESEGLHGFKAIMLSKRVNL